MKEFLTRIGIGAAKVDTVLPKRRYRLGETVDARVDVTGGSAAQQVDDIYLAVMTRYHTDDSHGDGVIAKFQMAESFTIEPGEERSFETSFAVPWSTPLSLGGTRVWIKTGLDVDWALDPKDKDTIQVEPDDRVDALLEAMDRLGFHMRSAKVERGGYRYQQPFVQEIEFKPDRRGKLKEVELLIFPDDSEVDVVVEVDRKMGGLAGALGGETERKRKLTYTDADPDAIAAKLEQVIASA